MEDGRLMQSMLLDFYGQLLTEKQRECYDLHYNEDLSLSEIAEHSGISRQAVWDNIHRAEAALKQTEDKTGLVKRFFETNTLIDSVKAKLEKLLEISEGEAKRLVEESIDDINSLRI